MTIVAAPKAANQILGFDPGSAAVVPVTPKEARSPTPIGMPANLGRRTFPFGGQSRRDEEKAWCSSLVSLVRTDFRAGDHHTFRRFIHFDRHFLDRACEGERRLITVTDRRPGIAADQ
jgi:hypothetical protein